MKTTTDILPIQDERFFKHNQSGSRSIWVIVYLLLCLKKSMIQTDLSKLITKSVDC